MSRKYPIVSAVLLAGLLAGTGCMGSKARDLQVMESASKAEAIQTQRTILDLRIEIQNLQRNLGAARAAQGRLEGELKEAQRRAAEAQQVVDSQREELAKAREEREKTAQTGREVQGQLVELGRLRQQVADAARDQTRIQALETALEKQSQEVAELKASVEKGLSKQKTKAEKSPPRKITVQPGDTLQELARKHRVDPVELKALNKLTTDRLVPGRELILPAPKG